MNTQHTPGPWGQGARFWPGHQGGLRDVISIATRGEVIAHINCGFGNGAENARLIAAAPEMLEALIALEEMLRGMGCETRATKALIDKVTNNG